MDTQRRKFFITVNNPINHSLPREAIKNILYNINSIKFWAMSDEVGKEGTHHTHIVLYSDTPIRHSTLRNVFNKSADIEPVKSSLRKCIQYIKKETDDAENNNIPESYEEWGVLPQERQGKRTDLINIVELVEDGASNDEIRFLYPSQYFIYKKNIDRLRYELLEKNVNQYKINFRDIFVTYLYGKTGVGKSKYIVDQYGYENIYRITDYKNPWDLYNFQDIVVFEDFYGQISLENILLLLDGHPNQLPARYNNKSIACYKTVWFTSNDNFGNLYKSERIVNRHRYDAFLRRINKVIQMSDNGDMNEINKNIFSLVTDVEPRIITNIKKNK